MKLTRKQLCQVGKALYGENWKTALGKVLGLSDRTIRRHATTGVTLTDVQVEALRGAMKDKVEALAAELKFLNTWG